MIGLSARLARRIALLLALLLGGFWITTERLARPWVVHGDSMAPALRDGDRVVVDLWTYRQRRPHPGEIVLFRGPRSVPNVLVKRVAAPAAGRRDRPHPRAWPGSTVGGAGLWLLGDNRGSSEDSRSFGAVPRDRVLGRVAFRYWPPSRAGVVDDRRTAGGFRLPVR